MSVTDDIHTDGRDGQTVICGIF